MATGLSLYVAAVKRESCRGTKRKHYGALLVGFYEGKKFKFAGRVRNKIRVDHGARIEATGHRTKAPMTGVQCNF